MSSRAINLPGRSYARPSTAIATDPTVFVVRHGDTTMNSGGEENLPARMRGWASAPLTADGRKQAEMAGRKLAGKGVKQLYSSDLQPAMDTAKIIGKHLGLEVKPLPELRTWDMGAWTDEPTDKIRPKLEKLQNEAPDKSTPAGKGFDGESFNGYLHRLKQGINHVRGQAVANGPVVAVTHGHPIRALQRVLDGRSPVPMEGVAEHGDVLPLAAKGESWKIGGKL